MRNLTPNSKFKLDSFHVPHNGHCEWKYIVILNGKFSRVWCDNKVRFREDALKHFWRFIGAA